MVKRETERKVRWASAWSPGLEGEHIRVERRDRSLRDLGLEGLWAKASVSSCASVFQMMSVLMNTIVFEDCRNQWSVSRPLLGLILLHEKVSVVAGRPSEQAVTGRGGAAHQARQ